MHSKSGWQSIMWATLDDLGGRNYGPKFRPIELWGYDLHAEGIEDVYEALFGPYPAYPVISDDETLVRQYRVSKQKAMVCTVQTLLGAVGIDYRIATKDGEEDEDHADYFKWHMDGDHGFFARETRAACGFQLDRDPEEKKEAEDDRVEYLHELDAEDDQDDSDSVEETDHGDEW